jgi:CRISPR/Cas system-associated exonuclease Cas4 (RecB family)
LLTDVTALLPEFEEQLIKLLNEVYDIKAAFTQTENAATCEYCSFKDICGR